MWKEITGDEANVLHLLQIALQEEAITKEQKTKIRKMPSHAKLLEIAQKHAVLPVMYDVLENYGKLSDTERKMLFSEAKKTALQSYRLLFLSRQISEMLQNAGIAALIIKGASIAAWYPVPEMRKSGDVDVLLLQPEKEEEACGVLCEAGFCVSEMQHANHHVVLTLPKEGIDVELHTLLAEPFDNDRINTYLQRLISECRDTMVRQEIMGVELPVLSEADQAFELLLHMLQHFLRSGFGLKLLCDWVVFWNRAHEEAACAHYLKMLRESGLKGFNDTVTAVCVYALGLKEEHVRFMFAGGDELPDRRRAEAFLREIFDAEEFGKTSADRMVVLRGTGVIDYVREFHHQMCLNFPCAGKVFLAWPVLWIVTLVRFLHNNRTIRHVSASAVLKTAGARSKLVEEMHLFAYKD